MTVQMTEKPMITATHTSGEGCVDWPPRPSFRALPWAVLRGGWGGGGGTDTFSTTSRSSSACRRAASAQPSGTSSLLCGPPAGRGCWATLEGGWTRRVRSARPMSREACVGKNAGQKKKLDEGWQTFQTRRGKKSNCPKHGIVRSPFILLTYKIDDVKGKEQTKKIGRCEEQRTKKIGRVSPSHPCTTLSIPSVSGSPQPGRSPRTTPVTRWRCLGRQGETQPTGRHGKWPTKKLIYSEN